MRSADAILADIRKERLSTVAINARREALAVEGKAIEELDRHNRRRLSALNQELDSLTRPRQTEVA